LQHCQDINDVLHVFFLPLQITAFGFLFEKVVGVHDKPCCCQRITCLATNDPAAGLAARSCVAQALHASLLPSASNCGPL
jgi:hypothetical protein